MSVVRPNLFIVGAPKCGTTAWVEYLSSHEDIFFTDPKEPHFFNTDMPGFRWYKHEADYLALFEGAGDTAIRGESSIMYLYSQVAARNIHAFNPDARILIFIRSHGAFIASYHQQLLYNRDEDELDLSKVWNLSGQRPEAQMPPHCREPQFVDYKSVGNFAIQIERFLDLFPTGRVKVIEFENWTRNPRETYLEILDFLGLPDDGKSEFEKVNAAHRHKSAKLADLTQRPPGLVSAVLRQIRKIPGLADLRLGRWLRRLNRAEGYEQQPDTGFLAKIDAFYASDKAEIERIRSRLSDGA